MRHITCFKFLLIPLFLMTLADVSIGAEFNVNDAASFQSALTTAMSNGENDLINVAVGTYTLSSTLTYILTAEESAEGYSLTIEGAGPDDTILDGDNAVQIISIDTQEAADDSGAHFIVRNMTFQNGSNAGQAAGLSIWTGSADITVDNCVFENNVSTGSSSGDGGGTRLRSQSDGEITVKNSEFIGNEAYQGAGVWAISYIYDSEKTVQLTNNIFMNNTARRSYGGAYADGNRGKVILDMNAFVGNSAAYSGGGAWARINSSTSSGNAVIIMRSNFFVDNSADSVNGGGAYAEGGYGKTYIFNNTFYNNSAGSSGGGLYVDVDYSWTVEAYIYNNIIWSNSAVSNGDDLYVADKYDSVRQAGSPVSLYNNLYINFFIAEGNSLTSQDNIIGQDPSMDDEQDLTESSPCIDAGTNDVPDPPGLTSKDANGKSRVMDGDEDGTATVDIGADEWFVATDLCPDDPDKTDPGVCGCGTPDTDSDGDGTPDCSDDCPNDQNKTDPGICGCGTPDTDSDGDGTPDCSDECPSDQNKTDPGICGCDTPDTDSDGDGIPDCNDECPSDQNKTDPGICGCGVSDKDTDSDGTPDCNDECENDPDKTAPGVCGCGVADTDGDQDGMLDCWEETYGLNTELNDADEDLDGDGFTNIEEFEEGTEPDNSNSHPTRSMPWLPLLLGDY